MWQRSSEGEAEEKAQVRFFKSDSSGLVELGVFRECWLFIGSERSDTVCCNMSGAIEGLGNTTLTVMNFLFSNEGTFHDDSNLVVNQLHELNFIERGVCGLRARHINTPLGCCPLERET